MAHERTFSFLLASLLIASGAFAAEGRVSEKPGAQPDVARKSQYVGRSERTGTAQASSKQSKAARTHASKGVQSGLLTHPVRAKAITLSHRSSYFYIYDADAALLADEDADGYYSEFRIRFDADSTIGNVRMYARLYLRRAGEADWLLYYETDDFWVDGDAGNDDYFVTTTLDEGFAAGDYDVMIDLYESGYDDIAATLGPNESGELALLPLEEAGLDAPIAIAGFSIRDVATTLLIDEDGDDHFSRFSIRFDPDAEFDGGYAYARIWVRATGGEWIEEHVTDDFLVDSSGDADAYTLTADWLEGYPTAYYDVQIDLYEADSGLLAAQAGSERPALAQIPLEDASRDVAPNPPVVGDGPPAATSRERGGGGSMGVVLLLALVGAGALRTCRES